MLMSIPCVGEDFVSEFWISCLNRCIGGGENKMTGNGGGREDVRH